MRLLLLKVIYKNPIRHGSDMEVFSFFNRMSSIGAIKGGTTVLKVMFAQSVVSLFEVKYGFNSKRQKTLCVTSAQAWAQSY